MSTKLPAGTQDKHWSDPENWKAHSFYCCKADPRIIVPKRTRNMGWTINCAHTLAWITLLIAIGYPLGLIVCLAKTDYAVWLIPGLGLFALIPLKFCQVMSSPGRYEEED